MTLLATIHAKLQPSALLSVALFSCIAMATVQANDEAACDTAYDSDIDQCEANADNAEEFDTDSPDVSDDEETDDPALGEEDWDSGDEEVEDNLDEAEIMCDTCEIEEWQVEIEGNQAIGRSLSAYTATECVNDWIATVGPPPVTPPGPPPLLAACSAAATNVCTTGYLTTWNHDRIHRSPTATAVLGFQPTVRHELHSTFVVTCTDIPDGSPPDILESPTDTLIAGEELLGLVNGNSQYNTTVDSDGAFSFSLNGLPPGIINLGYAGLMLACTGHVGANNAIYIESQGKIECQGGKPRASVNHLEVSSFPSSHFKLSVGRLENGVVDDNTLTIYHQDHQLDSRGSPALASPRCDDGTHAMARGVILEGTASPSPRCTDGTNTSLWPIQFQ